LRDTFLTACGGDPPSNVKEVGRGPHRPPPPITRARRRLRGLLVALSGTSIAAVEATVPNNSVGTAQLKSNAVTAAKIASNAVTAAKIASNAVASAKIASNAVNSAKVQDGTLVKADFKAGELPASVNAFARFLDGPIAIPLSSTTLTSLAIPETGTYVLWAKAYLTGAVANVVTCRLEAAGDFDQSQASPAAGAPAALSLMVTHNFTATGSADFKCAGTVIGASANFIKISAIKVAALTNTG
jgi:hypothetical protein